MSTTFGSGNPAAGLGLDGDYYVDQKNRFVWGPKANGSWVGTQSSLQGPTGPALLSGSGAPSSNLGAVAQGYVDLLSGSTYLKAPTGWQLVLGNAFRVPPAGTGAPSRSYIDAGFYWNQSYTANNMASCQKIVQSVSGTTGIQPFGFRLPYAGTVKSASVTNSGGATGSNYVNFYKNGTAGTRQTISTGTGTNGTTLPTPVSYAAGDVVSVFVSNSSSGNFQLSVFFEIEWSV